ncbi:MAG: hypothetical protein KDK05_18775 [Candidatus Competibacteraceae bacterium]|nr:hypothetical protein [Candidatus Competibacteraceae bacterium]
MGLLDLENAPRGVRNNNPGNIVKGEQWQGLVDGTDPRFATFASPEMGIRALGRNLLAYQNKHGLNTVSDIINRWAPSNENNTGAYIRAVAGSLGVGPSDKLNLSDQQTLAKLSKAIIQHENGKQPYSDQQINAGMQMALGGRKPGLIERAVNAVIPSAQADTLPGKQMANPYDSIFASVQPGQKQQDSPYDAIFADVQAKQMPQDEPAATPSAKPAAPSAEPITRTDKLVMGMTDPIQGGAQLLTHMLPAGVVQAGNDLNNWIADKTGLVAKLPAGGIEQQTQEREKAYQAQRAAAGESGFDGWRTIGNVASPANAALAARGLGAATTGARVLGGAVTGAVSAALNPVIGGDFASEKAKQMGVGATFGAAMPAITAGFGRLVSPRASINPDLQAMREAGVNPTIGQALGGRWNAAEEKLTGIPLVGDMVARARGNAQQQFNNAAINKVGEPIGVRVNGIGQGAVKEMGDAASAAQEAAKNMLGPFRLDTQGAAELANVRQMVGSIADNRVRGTVNQALKTLDNQFGSNGVLLPDSYKMLQSRLTKDAARMTGASDAYQQQGGEALQEIGRILQESARRQNPAFDDAMRAANEAWAKLVRIEGAATAAKGTEGVFTPGQLLTAVRGADTSVRDRATARGTGLLQDFATSAQNVLGNKVPDSGTAGRTIPSMLLGAFGFANPYAVAAGLLGGSAMYTQPAQKALVGLLANRPEAAQAVRGALLKASPGLVPLGAQVGVGLLQQPSP